MPKMETRFILRKVFRVIVFFPVSEEGHKEAGMLGELIVVAQE